ncbi:MAG: aminoacyl-tRNA hydrolase [Acidobacteriia bacterium]|nr:aminoacyl-tRNA hydrolase [Terriglobia bacterium]
MRIVVGLGNPGERFAATPHNLGFLVVDKLADRLGIEIRRPESQSLVGRGRCGEWDVVVAKPQTFMNLSGQAVQKLLAQHQASPEEVIVVVDDLDLPWGRMRIRERGNAGTHNGMRSVVGAVGTDFARLRMGIAPEHAVSDPAAFVLAPFEKMQRQGLEEFVDRGAQALFVVLSEGTRAAMNQFNAAPEAESEIDSRDGTTQ